MQVANHISNV
jgi:hypothetical protein